MPFVNWAPAIPSVEASNWEADVAAGSLEAYTDEAGVRRYRFTPSSRARWVEALRKKPIFERVYETLWLLLPDEPSELSPGLVFAASDGSRSFLVVAPGQSRGGRVFSMGRSDASHGTDLWAATIGDRFAMVLIAAHSKHADARFVPGRVMPSMAHQAAAGKPLAEWLERLVLAGVFFEPNASALAHLSLPPKLPCICGSGALWRTCHGAAPKIHRLRR